MTIDELQREALQLDPSARASLAGELLASLDDLSAAEVRSSNSGSRRRFAALRRWHPARCRFPWTRSSRSCEPAALERSCRVPSCRSLRDARGGRLLRRGASGTRRRAPGRDRAHDAAGDEVPKGVAARAQAYSQLRGAPLSVVDCAVGPRRRHLRVRGRAEQPPAALLARPRLTRTVWFARALPAEDASCTTSTAAPSCSPTSATRSWARSARSAPASARS